MHSRRQASQQPGPGLRYRFGLLEDSWIRDNPQEPEQAWPWEADRRTAAQLCIKPVARPRMLGKGGNVRVDQKVGVEENHL
jgi:hypothetical protein